MLKVSAVTRQIIASRVAYWAAKRAIREGTHTPELYNVVRAEMDVLVCLLDEAPEKVHWKINGLISKFEELSGKLVN